MRDMQRFSWDTIKDIVPPGIPHFGHLLSAFSLMFPLTPTFLSLDTGRGLHNIL